MSTYACCGTSPLPATHSPYESRQSHTIMEPWLSGISIWETVTWPWAGLQLYQCRRPLRSPGTVNCSKIFRPWLNHWLKFRKTFQRTLRWLHLKQDVVLLGAGLPAIPQQQMLFQMLLLVTASNCRLDAVETWDTLAPSQARRGT